MLIMAIVFYFVRVLIEIDLVGQVLTQIPHPKHCFSSKTNSLFSKWRVLNWHLLIHVPQPTHVSRLFTAIYLDAKTCPIASGMLNLTSALMVWQQHEQQLQR